jgi:hypothetical protein
MLHIFSDGKFPDVTDFSLGNLTPIYHSIGSFEPPTNVGITAFAINDDPNVSEKREAFAQIKNASPESQTIDATLYVDDKLFDAQANVAIPAGRSAGISFPLTGLFQNLEQATKIRLVVTPDDALAQDNTAFAVVNPPRLAQILVVTPGNDFLRLALATEPILKMANVQFRERDFLTDREFEKRALLGEYDLIVFDQCQPGSMPNCSTLFIGMPPPGEQWKFGDPQFPTPIIDFFRTHPLMTSLQLASVSILEGAAITGPAGTQSLIDSVYGSVMAIAPRGGYQDLVMSFTLQTFTDEGTQVNTDWPSQLSFPLFIQNVVSNLAGGSRFLTIESVAPGQPTRLRPSPTVTKIGVSTPAGRRIELTRDKSNSFLFSQTDRVGIYSLETLESSGATPPAKQLFAVNLFDPQETDITVRDELEIGFDPVKATTDVLPSRTEFWKWAVIAALAVLLIEWYVYNRRVLI